MKQTRAITGRWAIALGLVALLLAGCAAQPGVGADPALQQRVADQEARIAGLEGKVSALQTAVAQAGTRPAATKAPTPAPLPAVTDLPVNGTTKGTADAKVTITEYSDYL